MTFKERQDKYEEARKADLDRIKDEENGWKQFRMILVHYTIFPLKWAWLEMHDWRTWLILPCVIVIVGCEVWIPMVIAFFAGWVWDNEALQMSCVTFSVVCETIWLAPGTPFMGICIGITAFIKELLDRKNKKSEVKQNGNTDN